ncbi:MAG: ABC-type transport auxiliary lipoprotein family protein [bacterium]
MDTKRKLSMRLSGRRISVGLLAASIVGAFLMAGCQSGPAPRDHFYRMQATPPESPAGTPVLEGVLVVDRFSADALTRGRPILYRRSEDSLEVVPHGYHLWMDSPSVLLQGEMIDYLRAAGVADEVVTPTAGADADWALRGHVNRLEYVSTSAGNRAVVELELRVARPRAEKPLLAGTYRVEHAAIPGSIEETVRAFSEALTELMAQLAKDLDGAR